MRALPIFPLTLLAFALRAGAQSATVPAEPATCIAGSVSVAQALAPRAGTGGTLFVYLREIEREHGAPTAVVTLKAPRYPQRFRLCPADQMLPGAAPHPLTGRYRLYARHSPSGAPMIEEGLLGTAAGAKGAGVRAGQSVLVVIDRELKR